MLNYEGAKKGSKNMPTDSWTPDELDLVAAELKLRFPKKAGLSFYKLEFTPDQVEEAAEAVLPQHRHKSISDYHDIRRPMYDAFTRIAQPPGKRPALAIVPGRSTPEGVIKWSPQEWEAVILELHSICPEAFEEGLKNVTIGSVRLAMEVLSIPRRRQFKQIVSFKEQALRTWDDLPIDVKDPSKAERVIVDFPSGPVMAPPVTSKMKESPMAAALQKAFTEPPKEVKTLKVPIITEKPRKKRVFWTAEDWLMIAREMLRQDPFGTLLTSSFPRIDLAAIKAAQRNIFKWEKHKVLSSSNGLRDPLIAAFAALKEEIANKNDVQVGQVQTEEAPDSAEVPMTPAEKTKQSRINSLMKANAARAKLSPEERRAATLKVHATRLINKAKKTNPDGPVVPHSAYSAPVQSSVESVQAVAEKPIAVTEEVKPTPFVPLPATEMAFFGKVLNAALPLMNVLIDEAVSRLAPSLTAAVVGQVEKSLGSVVERVLAEKFPKIERRDITILSNSAAIAQQQYEAIEASLKATESPAIAPGPLSKAELAQYLPQPTEKPKKPKIAMLMSSGPQREQIRYSFPEYEFVFIDHGHGIKDAAKSCVLFVAVEKFINSNNKQQIKAYVDPEILKYVDGGVSAIKRQINVWKVQQKA